VEERHRRAGARPGSPRAPTSAQAARLCWRRERSASRRAAARTRLPADLQPGGGHAGHDPATGSETHGELFEVEFLVEPGDWTGPDHIHLSQEERLEVMSGQLRLRVGGTEEPLIPGFPRVLEPGTSHNLRNEGPAEARLLLQLRPALRMEGYLRDMWPAANEGSKRRWGAPGILELAVIQREYPDEFFYLSGLPVSAQKTLLAGLAVPGRARGYRAGRGQAH
jgi:mannose-6-phosphate isomerase-like protein (cupin superfamily)